MLELRDISKSFGANRVLNSVSLCLDKGEVLGLVGENGAGKSTLMNILGGVVKMDEGSIFFDKKEVIIDSPKKAIKQGIAFIHQELNLISDLSVGENLFLGNFPKTKFGTIDKNLIKQKSNEIFVQMGLKIDEKSLVSSLDIASRQLVETAKALLLNAKIIIMDEPTSSLSEKEINLVFDTIRRLKNKGVSFIFISHKLREVLEICDNYMVLRDGVVADYGECKNTNARQIAEKMVGHVIEEGASKASSKADYTVLEAEDLSLKPYFEGVSFKLRKGESIGFAGLINDGRSELAQSLFGLFKPSGDIIFSGKKTDITSPLKAKNMGLGYVPPNRKENAIIKDLSVIDNFAISKLEKKKFWLNSKKIKENYTKIKESLNIRANDENGLITTLSGGNQQKLILARWLNTNPKLLILDNPTQGVDIAAKEDIYDIILKQKDISLIVLSNESMELKRLCDRVYVFYKGKISACLKADEINDKNIMLYATGAGEVQHE